ncbi:MAG: phosphotransferase [Chromatiales bacterium]
MPERLEQLKNWLQTDCGLTAFEIEPASGDASFRRYFRITLPDGDTRIAMDAPPEKENCEPFVRIARQLAELGLHVPAILAEDLQQGYLLLSDLGSRQYLAELNPDTVDRHYGDALSALLVLQTCCSTEGLPEYDRAMLWREMELFREWLLQQQVSLKLTESQNLMLDQVFELLIENALQQPKVCVHRDYHSRNLMVTGSPSPGILDFQDAVAGPITYDLVSLLKDCYIDWPRQRVIDWAMGYFELCVQSGLLRSEHEKYFLRWFDLMGVQRHLKAAGIFARLNIRDGKPGYLADIPRTLAYIKALDKEYPELADLEELITKAGY